MTHENPSPSSAAPVRVRSNEPVENASQEAPTPQVASVPPGAPQGFEQIPLSPPEPPYRPEIADDLRVPWGWVELALFVILGLGATFIITFAAAQIAVRLFAVAPGQVFGDTMSTAKSIVVLLSQAVLDAGAILFLYLLVSTRSSASFWPTIGWRAMRPGMRKLRDSAMQFVAGGAALALVVTFAGAFLNSKESLPIEELLKARVSILLFGILGVLVAPLVEETIFRGFLYPVIARQLGVVAGVAITGTLFGLMHAAQLWGGWGQIALLILVGIVLTWVRARTGTVAASFFVHLGYNGLQLAGYLVYLAGGSHH